jgi:hypothetical protein
MKKLTAAYLERDPDQVRYRAVCEQVASWFVGYVSWSMYRQDFSFASLILDAYPEQEATKEQQRALLDEVIVQYAKLPYRERDQAAAARQAPESVLAMLAMLCPAWVEEEQG